MNNDRLITIAIYTYEKAQIIKGILESQGISVMIQNVNLIQPVISAGVRVRILESDLPHALSILEHYPSITQEREERSESTPPSRVLIPIDFSDYSFSACKVGFEYAHSRDIEVTLLHVYYTPFYLGAIPVTDTYNYTFDMGEEASIKALIEGAQNDMNQFIVRLEEQIEQGTIQQVNYRDELREGVPEDEILRYCKDEPHTLVVMGTRGKNQKEFDLIGSVTAQVIDTTHTPLLAVPEKLALDIHSEKNKVGFVTNFNAQDLVALERFMQLFGTLPFELNFVHLSTKEDEWDEIKLEGIRNYFKKQYPQRVTHYSLLDGNELLENLERYIHEEGITLLVIPSRKRGVFARLFNPSMASKMLLHSDTPLVVIPS